MHDNSRRCKAVQFQGFLHSDASQPNPRIVSYCTEDRTNDENLNTGLSCLFAATSYQLVTLFECKSKCNMATGGVLKGKTITGNTHFGLIQHTWTACSAEFCSCDTSMSELVFLTFSNLHCYFLANPAEFPGNCAQ